MDHINLYLGPCRVKVQSRSKRSSWTTMESELANCPPTATLVTRQISKDLDHQQHRCQNLKSRNTRSSPVMSCYNSIHP
jgi:hypothetical protein